MTTKELVIELRKEAMGQKKYKLRWLMMQAAWRLELEMKQRLKISTGTREGYWCRIQPMEGLYCSECGDEIYGELDPEYLTPFCGECGARMLNYETGIPMVREENNE